jgi:hypothetical protein
MTFIKLSRNNNILNSENFKIVNLNYNYKDLHPCYLKNKNKQIMENIWQSLHVHSTINACTIKKFDTMLWKHNKETHLSDDKITDSYYLWREKLINNKYPIKYPFGYSNRNKYKFILYNDKKYYNISDAFNDIHTPMYYDFVKNKPRFIELQQEYKNGQELLIIDDNLPYYPFKFFEKYIFNSPGFSLAMALNKIEK